MANRPEERKITYDADDGGGTKEVQRQVKHYLEALKATRHVCSTPTTAGMIVTLLQCYIMRCSPLNYHQVTSKDTLTYL